VSTGWLETTIDSEDELKKKILRMYVKLSLKVPLMPTAGICF
jgi:hypothetical protein